MPDAAECGTGPSLRREKARAVRLAPGLAVFWADSALLHGSPFTFVAKSAWN